MSSASDRCPCCGQLRLAAPQSTEQRLREWCEANGHHIAADGSVYETTAALLLDRAPNTLANWRSNGGAGVPYFRSGRTGRVRYRLADLANHIDGTRVTD